MQSFLITFRSVTYAQRGERVLQRAGYRCTVQRTPHWMEEQGCGYSLRVQAGNIAPAVSILRENQLPLRKVYAVNGEGKLEELAI